MDEFDETRAPSPAKLSKTPSWVMLGFVLGVVFVLALPRRTVEPVGPLRVAAAPSPVLATPPTVERALFFESVFAEWSKYAAWESELTEVAFWNADTKSFSDRFEVFRSGERNYFRSIPHFTRPLLTHGVPANSPLQFTEPQEARDQWLRENSAQKTPFFYEQPMRGSGTEQKKP